MKQINTKLYKGTVTDYYEEEKLYLVNYEDGDKEIMSYRQINPYKYADQDKTTIRRITRLSAQFHQANILKEMKNTTSATGGKQPAHFANAVYDDDTDQILNYKKVINHNKKEIQEWWPQPLVNEFGKTMKGVGHNAKSTQ